MVRSVNPNNPEEVRRGIQLMNARSNALQSEIENLGDQIAVLESLENEYEAVTDSNVTVGVPVYVKINGHIDIALADNVSTRSVIGLVSVSASATFVASYNTSGKITLYDWTLVTGSSSLSSGSVYFLSDTSPGTLTVSSPTLPGSSVVEVGVATSTTTLNIDVSSPILL